jgi:hypothetical protein
MERHFTALVLRALRYRKKAKPYFKKQFMVVLSRANF